MNIKSLIIFAALAKGKNIARVATELGIIQKTLVRNIHELEEEIGADLFLKDYKNLALTNSGATLLAHAEKIIQSVKFAENEVRLIGQNQEERIDVGAHGSAMICTIPDIHNELARKNQNIEIVMHDLSPEEQISALKKNIVQIIFERHFQSMPNIQVELVISEPIFAALPANHELSKLRSVSIKDLQGHPVIGCTNKDFEKILISWFKPHGFKPNMIQQKVDSMLSAVALTSLGLGMSIVSSSMLRTKFNNVVYVPIVQDGNTSLNMYCAYKTGPQTPQLQKILQAVRNYRNTKNWNLNKKT